MVRQRIGKLGRGELEVADFTVKGARACCGSCAGGG